MGIFIFGSFICLFFVLRYCNGLLMKKRDEKRKNNKNNALTMMLPCLANSKKKGIKNANKYYW